MVWFIKARVQAGLSQEAAFKAARAKFGAMGTSRAKLLRSIKAVKGVDIARADLASMKEAQA